MTTATRTQDAIAILKADHRKVKQLFDGFEEAKGSAERKKIADEALKELRIHTVIEEEIFYPSVRKALGSKGEDIMDESDEEHRVAKTIIEELCDASPDDDHYEAKFLVLAENVRHHIREEEGEMFPDVRDSKADLEALAEKMLARKNQLMEDESELDRAEEQTRVQPYQRLS